MTKLLNSAAFGVLVRETRVAAGLTQTQLAERIGASRFWVAAFEKGKPGAELGLAIKAINALGLSLHVEHGTQANTPQRDPHWESDSPQDSDTTLDDVLKRATLSSAPTSNVTGWPSSAERVQMGGEAPRTMSRIRNA